MRIRRGLGGSRGVVRAREGARVAAGGVREGTERGSRPEGAVRGRPMTGARPVREEEAGSCPALGFPSAPGYATLVSQKYWSPLPPG